MIAEETEQMEHSIDGSIRRYIRINKNLIMNTLWQKEYMHKGGSKKKMILRKT